MKIVHAGAVSSRAKFATATTTIPILIKTATTRRWRMKEEKFVNLL